MLYSLCLLEICLVFFVYARTFLWIFVRLSECEMTQFREIKIQIYAKHWDVFELLYQ